MVPTPPDVHPDPATAAGAAALRFERWFDERGLDLPAQTRAQFVEMGVEALQRWPDRSSGDVLDELVAELDSRLARIVADEPGPATGAPPARRGLARFFGRRSRH